jgi:hypothetical protein
MNTRQQAKRWNRVVIDTIADDIKRDVEATFPVVTPFNISAVITFQENLVREWRKLMDAAAKSC